MKNCSVADRARIMKKVEKMIMDDFELTERPSVVVAFLTEPDFTECHYASNTSREDTVKILSSTALMLSVGSQN